MDRDSRAASIFRRVIFRWGSCLSSSNNRVQQQSIGCIAELLVKFDSLNRVRQNLAARERAHLLEQFLLRGDQTTVAFLDQLGTTNTTASMLRVFVDLLQFRQGQEERGQRFGALDFGELLNLLELFENTRLLQYNHPYSAILSFLRYFWLGKLQC